MTYPRLLWKGHGYRIIELSDAPVVFSNKDAEQPYTMERRADTNALGGETWLPFNESSPAGRILLPALVESIRHHNAERESDESDDS